MAYIFETRERMVRFCVPSNSIIGEVGVFKGEFSKFLYSLNPQKLILFDLLSKALIELSSFLRALVDSIIYYF